MIRIASALGLAVIALACTATGARAQESPSAPQPASTTGPTRIDQLYDGKPHLRLTPYIWAPTINANFQYTVPGLQRRHFGPDAPLATTIQVGPSQYAPKINTAGMLDVNFQQGRFMASGDAIYVNASTNATLAANVTGPGGRLNVPITIDSSARIATSIWEVAAGYSIAQGHEADMIMFVGYRSFPVNVTADYNTTVGNRKFVGPAGTVDLSANTSDVTWGVRGRAYFGQDHWVLPYYFDVGTGTNNQSWQAYGGAGYVFNHGQSILALWKTLNYNGFQPASPVQKMTLYGPVLGYSF